MKPVPLLLNSRSLEGGSESVSRPGAPRSISKIHRTGRDKKKAAGYGDVGSGAPEVPHWRCVLCPLGVSRSLSLSVSSVSPLCFRPHRICKIQ